MGNNKANIKRVAELAGVSTATVSRVFNRRPYVDEEVRKKILKIAQEINYTPKQTARKTNIAILIEGIETIEIGSYESMLLTSISKHIFKNRFTFEIIPVSEINTIHNSFCDVVISMVYWPESTGKIECLKNIPVVSINNPISGSNYYNIYSDHKEGIEKALDYLVLKGHRRIGFFRRTGKTWGAKERLKGYLNGLKKHNIEYEEGLVEEEEENFDVLKAIAKICKNNPSALICCGEDVVLEVVHSLYLLNKNIPQDISVISFENSNLSPFLTPPHTTISQNIEEIGRMTVEIIERIINGERIEERDIIIKNVLIERESVRKIR